MEKPTAVAKETPVEDFNLNRVQYKNARFLIHEGNHPNTAEQEDFGQIGPKLVRGFVEGNLYRGEQGYQLVLRTQRPDWPTHVAVSVAVNDPNKLQQFVSLLRGKQAPAS